jgi:hypothetical protein
MTSVARLIIVCGFVSACADDELNGIPEAPAAPQSVALILADPPAWDYGRVQLGTSSTTTITVSNAGNVDVQMTSIVFEPAVAFSAPLLDVVPLAPGVSHPLSVTFTPGILGEYGARMRVVAPPAPDAFVTLAGIGADCSAETCNDADDDCDGQIDEEEVCGPTCGIETCNGADDDCDGQTDEGDICGIEFVTEWYLLDDGSVHETVSSSSYVVDYHGDPDLYWYEPSGAHGLVGSGNPQADFGTMRDYVVQRGQRVSPSGPFTFRSASTLATFSEATFTYVMCDFDVPAGDDPSRYRVRLDNADDGIQLMVNGEIVGHAMLGEGPLEWVLTNLRAGRNTMVVILVDDSQVDKYVNGLGFYRDGVFVQ